MAYFEIDRLELNSASYSGLPLDLQAGEKDLLCLFSRDRDALTTVIDAVTGLAEGYTGRIFLDGVPLDNLSAGRRGVAFCGCNSGLYEHLSVAENLLVTYKGEGQKSGVIPTLEAVGLAELVDAYPDEITSGERLRLSFAKAVMSRPKLVVADLIDAEPTGFDGYSLISSLRDQARDAGVTLLALTNTAFHALNIADTIVYLSAHGILQTGTPEELMESPEWLEVATEFAFPRLNIFHGKVVEEQPYLFVEDGTRYFNLPARRRDYFLKLVGREQLMAVRPERVNLLRPEEVQPKDKNIVTISRIENIGLGKLAYFSFGDDDWCAFVPMDKVIYPMMKAGVSVAEDAWFFIDDDDKVLLDL